MFHPTAATTQDGGPCTTVALTAQEDGALTDLIQKRTKMMKNEKNAKKIDDFLTENPDLNPENLQVLKKLNADLEKQFERMETSWFSMMNDIQDVPIHTALEKMFNDVDDHLKKTL